jgi:putative ABC transport system substrate-binding protein
MPVIGYLGSASATPNAPYVAALREGLSETGYVEGQNLAIEFRWAEGSYDRFPALAADLVGRKVDVIATTGGTAIAYAAKNATSTIPIVFLSGDDPVAAGLVASLARPGGNLTGVSFLTVELMPKRLELLCELVPQASTIALLVNPKSNNAEPNMRIVQEAAHVKGVQLQILKASAESEIDTAFATLGSLLPRWHRLARSIFGARRDSWWHWRQAMLFRRSTLEREFAELGGLMS